MSHGGALGTTRNRTDTFVKYRNRARGISASSEVKGDASRLLEAALGSHVDPDAAEQGLAGPAGVVPPQYVQLKEAARLQALEIKAKMGELRRLHGQAALTTFDDTGSKELEIEVVTQEITRLIKQAEVRLHKFQQQPSQTPTEEKVRQNVLRTLASEVRSLGAQFRKQQKAYLSRLQQNKGGGGGGWLPDSSPFADGGADEYDPGFTEMQAMQAGNMDALADERDREVQKILTSIADLAQIMKDLSTLVIDQGTILDRIDYNMEQVSLKVEEGVGQLIKAEKSQKQSRLVMCIMFLVVAIIVMLLIVVFRHLVF
mmetsp:Transcript_18453/g.55686  ORF Transcript_18453/g.55686 Transcript_18453/m.55686 type:complete len:315 (+) Transcript_18453:298-1242(+)